ncbi:2,3-dihydro-2,3-dihydroxybenzoate dehydrogenase [Andreprevotia lacus DSM 23236]|jgi:2,3-dihydro-2,3-dihydroxybenzoate dehydrogenase|uniref:2,3-dihydro-2,3-dihydroxybenzoate dehydrogenase n=1 Tax=Andreprevotia lacus DSM 23236 TaxID=1121001 RepID=A0A1W1XQY2_9NEIS|nr:2,3-dihydro-2,3-dihydroxybenzoate dehydrogenase [Andreprevotia lacus]SMC25908.1 2,3-dihydro-2,3-dihydroxybenzoate dehydrogenase [Andreprevotia lacus DSM 23236]
MSPISNNNHQFHGRVALVTGAAQGIGAAVARMLAARGAAVALLDRDAAGLARTAESICAANGPALPIALDLCDAQALEAAVDQVARELGQVDILASVAGILRPGDALSLSDADWDDTFAVNTTAVFRLCRSVGRQMAARRSGSIVIVGSNAASTPRLHMAAYAASKAATAQFARCLALELACHGVRCNLVSPGSTDTTMQRQLWTGPESEAAVIAGNLAAYRLGIPLQRIAHPDDIAEAVCFLASDRARHITMHDLRVDGGATLDA